jgi:hypothetical protein
VQLHFRDVLRRRDRRERSSQQPCARERYVHERSASVSTRANRTRCDACACERSTRDGGARDVRLLRRRGKRRAGSCLLAWAALVSYGATKRRFAYSGFHGSEGLYSSVKGAGREECRMASRIEFEAHTDVAHSLQSRSFSCGCRRVSGPGTEFHVEWCPYHEANHGEFVEQPPVKSEQPLMIRRSNEGRARSR